MQAEPGARWRSVHWRAMALPLLLVLSLSAPGVGAQEDDDERPEEWSRPGGMSEWDGQITWDDDVVVLNGRNFELATKTAPHMLVEFYAPWCAHCQKLEPVYQKVASHLRLEGVPVVLAKIDAMANPAITKERGIAGFPSLHWFSYGAERHWGGGRNNKTMTEWIKYHARKDAVLHVTSTMEAEDYLRRCLRPVVDSSPIGCTSCIVKSFRTRRSFISSPLWTDALSLGSDIISSIKFSRPQHQRDRGGHREVHGLRLDRGKGLPCCRR